MVIPSSNKMVVAVSVYKALDVVCDYAIRLAKRSGKKTMMFVLLVHEAGDNRQHGAAEIRKLKSIKEIGKTADIDIHYGIVQGSFPETVAEYLYQLDCPLLVVGESDDRTRRRHELKEIETLLLSDRSWHHRNNHHFLMVSEKHQDSLLVYINQDEQGEEKT